MNEFHVESPLLHAAIWGGTECYLWDGYTNADKGDYGRALIEYFTSRLFEIHRLPGYEPLYVHGSSIGFMRKFGQLSEAEFENAYKEFERLYSHTQEELKKEGLVIDGKVKLCRSLRKIETDEILPQILNEDKDIEFPANIITSYAHDGRLYDYNSWMSIVRDVPVELIVMYNECLHHPQGVCAYNMHGGESEVWVVEKNIFGYTKLERECFKYEKIPDDELNVAKKRQGEFLYNKHSSVPDGSLFSSCSLACLPCHNSQFVQWLVEKEHKKNQKLFGLK